MVSFSVAALAAAAGRAARASPRLRRSPLNLTDTAAERVKSLLTKRHKVGAACTSGASSGPVQHSLLCSCAVA